MPFTIVRDDITRVKADAIVNAANEHLWAGGGVCGAIFKAAGMRKLQDACDEIGYCETGSAVSTPGFALPATYVIHAVGPVWQGGTHGERKLLASCYRASLELAASLGCESIAFPLISAGIYGYPHGEALEVAQEQIRAFLDTHDMDVTLVLFDPRVMELADDLRLRVERYIDDVYVGEHSPERSQWELPSFQTPLYEGNAVLDEAPVLIDDESEAETCPYCGAPLSTESLVCPDCGHHLYASSLDDTDTFMLGSQAAPAAPSATPRPYAASAPSAMEPMTERVDASRPKAKPKTGSFAARKRLKLPTSLRNLLTHMDAGFSETLLTMIDTRGLKDAQVYKRANLSRQHFSKIRSNPQYKPTKPTVLALAVALELSLDETTMLLERAGFALSHADQRDVIVEFFIREGIYDVFQINDALFAFDQPLLA